MSWYKVTDGIDLSQPFIRKVKAGSKQVCLVGYGHELYALGTTCPHAGADLSKGWCEGKKLICPFHRYSYSLATGRGSEGQNDYIKTYLVEQRVDGIYVQTFSILDRLKHIFKLPWTKKK